MSSGGFSEEAYALIRDGCRDSASEVVPLVHNLLGNPSRVIDVGCGEGWWGKSFADLGCYVVGVDDCEDAGLIPFVRHDLREPISSERMGRFNLAVCLEVAEHLPETRALGLVDDLCDLAPIVLFSAAIPRQGGMDHINEQWPAYWVERFKNNNYQCSGALRWMIWNNDQVELWYKQNLLIAAQQKLADNVLVDLFGEPWMDPIPVVHPTLFEAYT